MEQVIVSGSSNLLHTTDTEHNLIMGGSTWTILGDFSRLELIPTGGVLKNLRVELDGVPGGGGSYAFTLRRAVGLGGWANTALTCTIGSADTQADDMVNEVSVAAGDVITLECNPDAPSNARKAKWSMVFVGDTVKESTLLFTGATSRTGDQHFCVVGRRSTSLLSSVIVVCPTSGTIKNIYVWLREDPGVGGDAYRFTLIKNGTPQALTCTITAPDRTGNDVANPIAVTAGDLLAVKVEPLNSPDTFPWAACGMTFVADTDGESLLLGGSNSVLHATLAVYFPLTQGGSWTTTESDTYQLAQTSTLKKLYVYLDGAPGGTDKYTFTVRKNGASPASGLEVEIIGAATTGNDVANEITVVDDDEFDLMTVPTDSPTGRKVAWGLVSLIAVATAQAVGAGAITIAGTLGILTKLAVGGASMTIAGALGRFIKLAVGSGSIAIVGVLSAALTFFQAVGSGAIAIAGSLGSVLKLAQAVGAGSVAIAGTLGRLIKLGVGAGSISIVGSLSTAAKFFVNVGSGAISITGTLGRNIFLSVGQGAVSIVGAANFTLDRILRIKSILGLDTSEGFTYTFPFDFEDVTFKIVSTLRTDLTIKSTLFQK